MTGVVKNFNDLGRDIFICYKFNIASFIKSSA